MKKFKKYSPFVYFMGGMDGGAEKAPEASDESPKEEKDVTANLAKEEAKNLTGGAIAGLDKAQELNEGLSDEEAVKLYDEKINPLYDIHEFFLAKEKQMKDRQVRYRLERAFVAAGGEEGQSTKPSNLIFEGLDKKPSNTIGLKWLQEQMNKYSKKNHIDSLQKISKDGPLWSKFKKSLDETITIANRAKDGYEKS